MTGVQTCALPICALEVLTAHRARLDALAAKLIAEETVEGAAFEGLFSDLPPKPAAYATLIARLRAAGIAVPESATEAQGPAAAPGAPAGQPA